MNLLFFVNSVGLGIGLAIDAFSVSMANGLNEPKMSPRKLIAIPGTFGFFQAFMPMAGWLLVHTLLTYFRTFEKAIPWIALILLCYIGGKMLWESIANKEEENASALRLTGGLLLVQGIATSIDALSVGFTIAEFDALKALVCALIIGIMTFGISIAGVFIGRRFGTYLAGKAGILGGIILIAIGIEIFVEGII